MFVLPLIHEQNCRFAHHFVWKRFVCVLGKYTRPKIDQNWWSRFRILWCISFIPPKNLVIQKIVPMIKPKYAHISKFHPHVCNENSAQTDDWETLFPKRLRDLQKPLVSTHYILFSVLHICEQIQVWNTKMCTCGGVTLKNISNVNNIYLVWIPNRECSVSCLICGFETVKYQLQN